MHIGWRAGLCMLGAVIVLGALIARALLTEGTPPLPSVPQDLARDRAPSLAGRASPRREEASEPNAGSDSACEQALALASGEPDAGRAAALLRILGDQDATCFNQLPLPWQLAVLLRPCADDEPLPQPDAFFSAWYSTVHRDSTLLAKMDRAALFRMLACSSMSLVDATGRDGAACARFILGAWGHEPMPPMSGEVAAICESLVGAVPPDDSQFWEAFWEACGAGPAPSTVRALILRAVEAVSPRVSRAFLEQALAWRDPSATQTAAISGITLRGSGLARSLLQDLAFLEDDRLALIAVKAIPTAELRPSSDVPPIANPDQVERVILLEQPRGRPSDSPSNTALRATLLRSEWELLGPDRAGAALYSAMASGLSQANPEIARFRVVGSLRYIVSNAPPPPSLAAIEVAKRAIHEGIQASPASRISALIRAVASDMGSDDYWPECRLALREAVGARLSELPPEVQALIN